MAVFRVERNKGYTVMSNHHLRNKELWQAAHCHRKSRSTATRTIIHATRAKACNHPQPQKEDFIMAQKMTGALVFDERTDRYDIRFDLNSYYGGLHCGECFAGLVITYVLCYELSYDE